MVLNPQATVCQRLTDLCGPSYGVCVVTSRRLPAANSTFPHSRVAGVLRPVTDRTDWSAVYGPVWELWHTDIVRCSPWPTLPHRLRDMSAAWQQEAGAGLTGTGIYQWYRSSTLMVDPDGGLVWVGESLDRFDAATIGKIECARVAMQWAVSTFVNQITPDEDYTVAWLPRES